MTWPAVVLAVANLAQGIALVWIAAWQQRAAHEVRKLNGTVVQTINEQFDRDRVPSDPSA